MDLAQLLGGVLLIVGGVTGAIALPRLWRPVRRLVALVDTLAGRPERYPGDREAQPGLAERLDRIETVQEQVRTELSGLREEFCQTNQRLRRVEVAMNGWLPPSSDDKGAAGGSEAYQDLR